MGAAPVLGEIRGAQAAVGAVGVGIWQIVGVGAAAEGVGGGIVTCDGVGGFAQHPRRRRILVHPVSRRSHFDESNREASLFRVFRGPSEDFLRGDAVGVADVEGQLRVTVRIVDFSREDGQGFHVRRGCPDTKGLAVDIGGHRVQKFPDVPVLFMGKTAGEHSLGQHGDHVAVGVRVGAVLGRCPGGELVAVNRAAGQLPVGGGTVKQGSDGAGVLRLTGGEGAAMERRAAFQLQGDGAFATVADGETAVRHQGQPGRVGYFEKFHRIPHAGLLVAADVDGRVVFEGDLQAFKKP